MRTWKAATPHDPNASHAKKMRRSANNASSVSRPKALGPRLPSPRPVPEGKVEMAKRAARSTKPGSGWASAPSKEGLVYAARAAHSPIHFSDSRLTLAWSDSGTVPAAVSCPTSGISSNAATPSSSASGIASSPSRLPTGLLVKPAGPAIHRYAALDGPPTVKTMLFSLVLDIL